MIRKVAVALLIFVACFVVSAQEEFSVEFPMSTEIGNTAFSFSVPYEYGNNKNIATAYNSIGSYHYCVGSAQVWNGTANSFVALSYFKSGKPPIEVEKAAFMDSFKKSRGIVEGEGTNTVIAGYNATVWDDARMPYIDPLGLLAHMPAKLAYVDVDPYRTVSVVAQDPVFSLINWTLKLEIGAPSIGCEIWTWSSC